ncbi:aldo/keto reductase [Siccirubricoccus sp. KC 17139]|uniref:Aldo/keto reductase n=1 Tax=Siccirubricoccus soli TaxID=2899147 RepID=A0ABT1DD38_9PROT|nr:aldo/keto reductase [Siccirubricoccus soli]MCO6419853.1 aldo/keto reductase [Siccirubricoccus soli]MCP2685988.1 aldo/keto reductase [Siccirubricoccus soli]
MGQVTFPDGTRVPALGQGTWHMGERGSDRAREAAALRLGIDLGMTLIDTAEMYAEGGAEEVVAEAIAGRREEVFLVSKVYPHNAGGRKLEAALERSLKRLRVERLDLYLLHWRGSIPLAETVAAMERARAAGKIAGWGVSNLDVDDLEELGPALADCATDQVLYSLEHRGVEYDLLPFCRQRGMPVMAYSPVGQGGRLLRQPVLVQQAKRLGVTPAQLALAWTLRGEGVISIPKAADPAHVKLNAAARELALDAEALAALDAAFPPPNRKRSLAML